MSAGGNYADRGLRGPLDDAVLDLIKLGSFTETNPESQRDEVRRGALKKLCEVKKMQNNFKCDEIKI